MADQPNTTSAADELITAPAPPKPLDMKLLQAGDAAEVARFQQMGQAAALTDEQRLAQIANGVPLTGPSVSVGQQLTDSDFSGAVENLLARIMQQVQGFCMSVEQACVSNSIA
jgi:hypothetical protein